MRRALIPALLVLAGCEPAPQDASTPTGDEVGTARSDTTTPKAIAPEPSFNGDFETRDMGSCYVVAGQTECDWPSGLPTGWRIQAPHQHHEGLSFLYAEGHNPAAPLANRRVPHATSLVVYPCVPGSQMTLAKDGCVDKYVLVSSFFPVVSDADYRLSVWVRSFSWFPTATPQRGAVQVRVAWFDAAYQWIRTDYHNVTPDVVPVLEWTQDGMDVTAPANAANALAELVIEQLGDRFLYIDDVRLQPREP